MKTFESASLILNMVGTVIFAIPMLKTVRDLDDDLLVPPPEKYKNAKGKNYYRRKGFLKDRKLALLGLSLLFIGFALQFFVALES